ncbi:AraC family transcriptional regulator [Nocardia sp. NPDC051030]|uniref:AraC family transcriptional regulator n=1 Tax=Nocardia sp. NPDC051030 TaxID=3155162 RepID=UPI003437F59C
MSTFDWNSPRNASGVHALTCMADERGIPALDCLASTGVLPEQLLDPAMRIPAHEELRVVRNMLERCDSEPGLGIAAGSRLPLVVYGPLGVALLSSPTVRSAIDLAMDCLDLTFAFCRIELETNWGEARLVIHDSGTPPDVRPFLAERTLTSIRLLADELLGTQIPLHRIEFQHSAPISTARHRRMFGIEPIFDATSTSVSFDRTWLDQPLPQANAWARHTAETTCRALLTTYKSPLGTTDLVRKFLSENPTALPSLSAMAERLFISRRTLTRRLEAEGTSFRTLIEESRRTVAVELLTHTDLTTGQIATHLGYSASSPFIRAFRHWHGCRPQEFRAGMVKRSA